MLQGSGREGFARFNNTICFHEGESFCMNLLIASEVEWSEKAIRLWPDTRLRRPMAAAERLGNEDLTHNIPYPGCSSNPPRRTYAVPAIRAISGDPTGRIRAVKGRPLETQTLSQP